MVFKRRLLVTTTGVGATLVTCKLLETIPTMARVTDFHYLYYMNKTHPVLNQTRDEYIKKSVSSKRELAGKIYDFYVLIESCPNVLERVALHVKLNILIEERDGLAPPYTGDPDY